MENINLKLFWTFMLLCAANTLVVIWMGEHVAAEWQFKLSATLFIIGLANFLLWVPQVTYRFLAK